MSRNKRKSQAEMREALTLHTIEELVEMYLDIDSELDEAREEIEELEDKVSELENETANLIDPDDLNYCPESITVVYDLCYGKGNLMTTSDKLEVISILENELNIDINELTKGL